MGKKSVPDRWLDYQPLGQCISGTKIVAFKVPLKMASCRSNLPEKEWFTPAMLIEKQPLIKTVIDLTNTYRYYNPEEEFRAKGIDHVKILVEGRGIIPPESQMQSFFDAMDAHMDKYANVDDALVGVHCTHGLNRTGYFVCRWMIARLEIDATEAISRFNEARGHDIERINLLNHLKTNPPILPRKLKSEPSSSFSKKHEYRSPLDDSYDEPSNDNRYSRHGRRDSDNYRHRANRDRSNHYEEHRHSYNITRESRYTSTRADHITNWRDRDDRKGPDEERNRFRNFGGRKYGNRPRYKDGRKGRREERY